MKRALGNIGNADRDYLVINEELGHGGLHLTCAEELQHRGA